MLLESAVGVSLKIQGWSGMVNVLPSRSVRPWFVAFVSHVLPGGISQGTQRQNCCGP